MTKDGAYEIKMPAGGGGGGAGWWRNVYTDEERAKTTFGKVSRARTATFTFGGTR